MAVTATLGNVGQKINLLVSRGDDFGPHEVSLKKPDGKPYDLTGISFVGSVKRKVTDSRPACNLYVIVVDPVMGVIRFGITKYETARLNAMPTIEDPKPVYVWDFKIVEPTDRRIPLFYGEVTVQPSVTP